MNVRLRGIAMSQEESQRLESIANQSLYASGVNFNSIQYSFQVLKRFISGSSILEMGPAEGVMTELLNGLGLSLTLVEGSSLFVEDLRSRFPDAEVTCSLFETYQPGRTFDNIVLGHVLEHVDDPVAIIEQAGAWLTDSGRILAAVPNSRSLHRQAAVLMSLLPFEEQLNEMDYHHGHRRVYNPETFRRDFLAAGLEIEAFGGYWMKPVSNRQIEQTWTPEMVRAFMQLGERYPDIAGEIYVVARHKSHR
jgi:2-polyprenyl-3-methyl-5-hydroxy-6-metoxy-1,4-benzoquinol methylase